MLNDNVSKTSSSYTYDEDGIDLYGPLLQLVLVYNKCKETELQVLLKRLIEMEYDLCMNVVRQVWVQSKKDYEKWFKDHPEIWPPEYKNQQSENSEIVPLKLQPKV